METRADHLHKAPGTGWKHYFFEFLVLFLAVTLGFFVENQREHYMEAKRAKEHAIGLYQDLQSDTAELNDAIAKTQQFVNRADSILNEFEQPVGLYNDSLQEQMLFRMDGYRFYNPTLGVYTQVKNSGSLRYFNKDLVKKLTDYESYVNGTYKVAQSSIG